MIIIAYIDTNILMEHEPLDQLPLDDIVGGHVARVVIPYQVLKEIDKHKYAGDKRLRRRAEMASKLIARLRAEGSLHDGITVSVERPKSFDYAEHDLDPMSQDDRVMATVIQQRQTRSEDRHILLTADQHFAVLAEELGVEYVLINEYRLPAGEPHSHQPKPQLTLSYENGVNFLEASVPRPPDTQILAEAVLEKHWEPERQRRVKAAGSPLGSLSMVRLLGQWPNTREDVEAHAEALKTYARVTMSAVPVRLQVANHGATPADDLDIVLTFSLGTGVPFAEQELPDYPIDKDPYLLRGISAIRGAAVASNGPFVKRSEKGHVAKYHLSRVKHGMVESLDDLFIVPVDSENPSSFAFGYAIHCANLAEPVIGELHIKLESAPRLDLAAIEASLEEDE